MKGDSKDPGIIPRTLAKIFNSTDCPDNKTKRHIIAKMSYYEIYNEVINDLLDGSKKNLNIREDKDSNIFVKDLTQVEVQDAK